jgi:single-strand DNA-binding protein
MAKGTVNRVTLIGNVGKDPEIKRLDNGMVIANMSIATTETRKDKESTTEWHRLVFFGKLAEIVETWVQKGHKVYVEGKIQTRKWTNKEGVDQYANRCRC